MKETLNDSANTENEAKEIFEGLDLENSEKENENTPEIETKEETKSDIDKEAEELYADFHRFLERQTGIVAKKEKRNSVPTGIDLLDAILGGGFAVGAFHVIAGQPASGKSMLVMQTIGVAQRHFGGNKMFGAYLDSEESVTSVRFENLGIRQPHMSPFNDVTVEKVFKIVESFCLYKESNKDRLPDPFLMIWDSIANTLSEKEREAEDPNSVIGYKAKLLSMLLPKYVAKLAKYNICMIAINQLRDVISMGQFTPAKDLKLMTHTKDMPGGTALKYNCFTLLEMKTAKILTSEKDGYDGIKIKAKCVKNKQFSPNIEIELCGDFRTGFSNFWTSFNFLIETKRINAAAWCSFVSDPSIKFRRKEAEQKYKTDPEFKKLFDITAKEAIQKEIIEKNQGPAYVVESYREADKD